jgi:hypothetical protein
MEPNNEKAPLTTITQSGTYKLKLIRPKGTDKVKVWEDGTASCSLFFLDDKGFCLWKNFGTGYAKALAMLVGKYSSNFAKEIRLDATPAEYLEYISPACGQTCLIGVEVSHAKDKAGNLKYDKDGNPKWSYRFTYPQGSQKPTVPDALPPEGVNF